ncbi:MAG: patatin-like phospholipase family protein [Salibacteraceae bacterium]
MKRALVISGGGSKGAWAGGVAEYLIREKKYNYSLGVGSSTGSILLPHLLIDEVEIIKKIYTTVTTRDIFTNNPFVIAKKDGEFSVKLNHLNIIKSFLSSVPTFGDSHRLLKMLRKNLTLEQYQKIEALNKEVIITVSNLTKQRIEYKSSKSEGYADFVDWIWGSSNYVPFMSILRKNGCEYADGGFATILPIRAAIDFGEIDEVDVIVLTPKVQERNLPKSTNAFQTLSKVFDISMNHSFNKDLMLGQLGGLSKKVNVNMYYTPESLTEYPLVFDPKTMKNWWELGYEYAKNNEPECFCHKPE